MRLNKVSELSIDNVLVDFVDDFAAIKHYEGHLTVHIMSFTDWIIIDCKI